MIKEINCKNLLYNLVHIKNINKFKELIYYYIKKRGIYIIYELLNIILINRNKVDFNLFLNFQYYFPVSCKTLSPHKNDIHTMIFICALIIFKIDKAKTVTYMFVNKNNFDIDNTKALLKKYKWVIIILNNLYSFDTKSFEHVIVYNVQDDEIYDVLKDKIYIQDSNCTINSLCYIFDKINYNYNKQYLVTTFKLMQMNDIILRETFFIS